MTTIAPVPRLALTIAEAGAALGISDDCLYEHVVKGRIQTIAVTTGYGATAHPRRRLRVPTCEMVRVATEGLSADGTFVLPVPAHWGNQ